MTFPTAQGRTTFDQAFDPKNNAFGFLRLALAVLVIFSHSFPLGGFGIDHLAAFTKGRYAIGSLSVAMFFVLSGFLICRSASVSQSVPRFLWHRFLRIFPGYWVCLVVCACVFAPLMAFAEFGTLLSIFSAPRNSPQSFMISNAGLYHLNGFSLGGILFIRPSSIAGLLSHNPSPSVINGSLWSLPFEVSCYLVVAALAAVGVLRRARSVVLGLFAGFWCLYAFDCLNPDGFRQCFPYPGMKDLVLLCVFFSAGCVCYLYREKIPHSTASIPHLCSHVSGDPARSGVRFDCSDRTDLRVPLACVCSSAWVLRQKRGLFLWRLYLRISGAAGLGSAPHSRGGVRPLFYLLAASDIGLGIPELSVDRSSQLTIENDETAHVPT